MYISNDLEQNQLWDKIKRARSKCVPNPFHISELELDILIFRPTKQVQEPPSAILILSK
jgi:hypothetical protein